MYVVQENNLIITSAFQDPCKKVGINSHNLVVWFLISNVIIISIFF